MITHKRFLTVLLASLSGGLALAAAAQSAKPAVTLDQAVLNVQQETGGKILSAESRGVGRRQEYRIKVLTPDGHVKVMAIFSEASKNPSSNQSTRNPPEKNPGGKERH
jgi:hypothetical protein